VSSGKGKRTDHLVRCGEGKKKKKKRTGRVSAREKRCPVGLLILFEKKTALYQTKEESASIHFSLPSLHYEEKRGKRKGKGSEEGPREKEKRKRKKESWCITSRRFRMRRGKKKGKERGAVSSQIGEEEGGKKKKGKGEGRAVKL